MTGFADIRGGRMITGLTCGNTTIVTTYTATYNLIVIQRTNKWQPGIRWHAMTGFTNI